MTVELIEALDVMVPMRDGVRLRHNRHVVERQPVGFRGRKVGRVAHYQAVRHTKRGRDFLAFGRG